MLAAQRIQSTSSFSSMIRSLQQFNRVVSVHNHTMSSFIASSSNKGLLDLHEVETILNNMKADDIKVIPVRKECDLSDYMVFATGSSTWHVKNIAQALIYKVKQKQKGARHLLFPSVEGQEDGKWIVIDSSKVVVHALDENARTYYNLESLWSTETPQDDSFQEKSDDTIKACSKTIGHLREALSDLDSSNDQVKKAVRHCEPHCEKMKEEMISKSVFVVF